jgi:hypothetical protein
MFTSTLSTQRAASRADSSPLPCTPPTPTGNTAREQPYEILNLPAGYINSLTALPCAENFDDDKDTEHDTDFDQHMLTDEG